MSSPRGPVSYYINQTLAGQDLFAEQIDFPVNKARVLPAQDYEDYFRLISTQLAERKRRAALFTLTRGNEALTGLLAALKTKPPLFFNELVIHLAKPLKPQFLAEFKPVLEALSAAGLLALKLVTPSPNTLSPQTVAALRDFIRDQGLAIALELPPENSSVQQELDELASVRQRARRIADFKQNKAAPEVKGQGLSNKAAKRQRKKVPQQNIGIDIEAQVEVAVEVMVEKAVAEQFEDKEDKEEKEFINRNEFVHRVQVRGFKVDTAHYLPLQGHEKRTWDHWLGNISQLVVEARKVPLEFCDVSCDIVVRSRPPSFGDKLKHDYTYYGYVIVQPLKNQPPTKLYFVERTYSSTYSATFYSRHTTFCPQEIVNNSLGKFLATLYPAVKNHDYPALSLSGKKDRPMIDALSTITGKCVPNIQVTKLIEDPSEQWKGKKVYDAATVPGDEESIEALVKNCPIKFKSPVLTKRFYANPHCRFLTTTACEKLLQHQAQFQYGLDFQHLPAGFELVEATIEGKTRLALGYNATRARISKKDPLAIQLFTAPEARPLSQDLFKQWLDSVPKVGASLWLQNKYQALLSEGYQRKVVAQFKQYLPVLLEMPESALAAADVDFDSLIKAAKNHQKNLAKVPADFNKHLLLSLLKTEPLLIKSLKQWQATLKLTTADLNGFLSIYDAYSSRGLNALLTAWEGADAEILAHLHQHYFSRLTTYLPLMDSRYADAVNILNHLSQEEKQWWKVLFEQHMAAVGEDDLLALVKSFQAFLTLVKDKKLSVYAACKFKGIKSLPVALSRMVQILNKTSPADVEPVWQRITELDLQSNGAIRLVTDDKAKAGSGKLIVPEMLIQPEFYGEEHDYSLAGYDYDALRDIPAAKPKHGYQAIQISHLDPERIKSPKEYVFPRRSTSESFHHLISRSADQKELEKNYYRYLSAQESRLSLGFYQKAAKIIEEKVADGLLMDCFVMRKGLYAMVAAATSGFDTVLRLPDEETSLKHVKEVCDSFNAINFPGIIYVFSHWLREAIISETFARRMNVAPPLPHLRRLMDLVRKGFAVNSLALLDFNAIIARSERFSDFLSNVSSISDGHKLAFYDGIKCIDEDKISNDELFEFADVALEIQSGSFVSSKVTKVQGALIALMSTFALEPNICMMSPDIESGRAKPKKGRIYVKPGKKACTYLTDGMAKPGVITSDEMPGSFLNLRNLLYCQHDKVWECVFRRGQVSSEFSPNLERGNKLAVASDRLLDALFSGLSLLGKMQTRIPSLHTEADLDTFWKELSRQVNAVPPTQPLDTDKLAAAVVKAQFGQHFATGFFDQLHAAPLSAEVETIIAKGFESVSEQMLGRVILSSFKRMTDQFHRVDAIKGLVRIYSKLPKTERGPFLTGLSTLNSAGDNALEDLTQLMSELGNSGNINAFNYLLVCAKTDASPALLPKFSSFYQVVLPFIHGKKPKTLSTLELQPLAARLVLNSRGSVAAFKGFFKKTMDSIYRLVDAYPHEKRALLALLDSFISQTKETKPDGVCEAFAAFLGLIESTIELGDHELIRALCNHFNKKPETLGKILAAVKACKKKEDKHFILRALSFLLNNGRAFDPAEFARFLNLCGNQNFMRVVPTFFACPPYPNLDKIIEWHETHKNAADYSTQMSKAYTVYNKKPCEREPENGFQLADAKKLALGFKGVTFEEAELVRLEKAVEDVKTQESTTLKAELATFKTMSAAELAKANPRLLAILAELLYRSKGANGGHGKSYEMNSVQYLAVLAFLKSKSHMTGEMATGEGKSRAGMIAIACLQVLGMTVDFVTSDMQLAERDYLEYQAFFKMIDAEIRLITATSPTSAYREGAIHFSDAPNLNLYRNKAKASLEAKQVIDQNKQKRALFLDEADRSAFDISETRFNFSRETNEKIKNMEWIYLFLVRFFNQADEKQKKLVRELFEKDMDACSQAFTEFLKAQPEYNDEMLERVHALPLGQMEAWQEAAITALDLKLGTDYTIEPNVLIDTKRGPKVASEGRLIYSHRLSRSSKFSFGVHQCLHAYLNDELKNPHSATSKKCAEMLKKQGAAGTAALQGFFIHPEKAIVYSTTSKSFLDDYKEGMLWAVTGTAGATIEREEAAALYGKANGFRHPMEFVSFPRKEELRREDQHFRMVGSFEQRIAAIFEYIIEARKGRKVRRPALVICENDADAGKVRDGLAAAFAKLPAEEQVPPKLWQYVDSTTSSEEEERVVNNAGNPGCVTISTSRLGRGTDIKLPEALKNAGGLRVLGAYLPRERDQMQMFGRAGRYGYQGDARLIVDREQITHKLSKKKIDIDFFLANEFYVKSQQSRIDREKQVERLIRNALSDFRLKLTDNFFNYYDALKNVTEKEREEKLELWSAFLNNTDKLWNQAWPDLVSLTSQSTVDMHQVRARLAQFKASTQREWEDLHAKLKAKGSIGNLPETVDKLELDPRTEHLLRLMMPKRKYTMKDRTQLYKVYDKALDGRAAIYDQVFADWKAVLAGQRKVFANTRAWWFGHGILFADTRAWWAGKRPLFATLRAWMNRNAKAPAPEPLKSEDILTALQNHEQTAVKHFVRELDATQFLAPKKDDLLLSFRIQVVEAVLDFAHERLEKGEGVTKKDMDDMRALLLVAKAPQADHRHLVTAVRDTLQHTTTRFFGRSLKEGVTKLIQQREKEQAEDQKAVANKEPGWTV